jgi:hypothetical protein
LLGHRLVFYSNQAFHFAVLSWRRLYIQPAGLRYPMLRVLTGLIVRQAEGLCECGEKSARVIFPPSLRKPAAVEHASFGFRSQGALAG